MFNLERSIISAMQNANMKHCFIICNSEYVMKNRNRVQCTVRRNNDSSYLEFFVEHGLSTTLGGKRDVITDGMESLRMKANSNLVFGMNLPLEYNENGITVKPIPALNTVIIESFAYRCACDIAEKQIEKEHSGSLLGLDQIILPLEHEFSPIELGRFMDNFWDKSRIAYANLVYSNPNGGDAVFIKQLYKNSTRCEFYKIMNAFVPTFIDCSLFFNPLRDYTTVHSAMFTAAVSKNRVETVEKNDYTISAYFMTQEEICRAFGLSKFMRFTPRFLYDILMGLLYPGSDFPSINKKIMKGPATARNYGLSSAMSAQEYESYVKRAEDAVFLHSSINVNGVITPGEEFQNFINSYTEVNSLWVECSKFTNKILKTGAYMLDKKPDGSRFTTEDIYNIVMAAKL